MKIWLDDNPYQYIERNTRQWSWSIRSPVEGWPLLHVLSDNPKPRKPGFYLANLNGRAAVLIVIRHLTSFSMLGRLYVITNRNLRLIP